MIINHNISAMSSYRSLSNTQNDMSKTMEKLSSGKRINRAADDAAGLAISQKMRAQIGGLEQSVRNSQDSISLIQTAEGALNETHSMLNRMRDLAVQSANDTNGGEDRTKLDEEFGELTQEISRIAKQTEFNGKKLLDGSQEITGTGTGASGGLTFHIGANKDQTISLSIGDMQATALGGTGTGGTKLDAASITAQTNAEQAISVIDDAIKQVSTERSNLGAKQNRLEHTTNNLEVTRENLQAAESRIRDADMAKEMMKLNKQQILSQAGTAMLSQANAKNQGVLQLLG